jgi:hypothetical protein
MLLKSPNGNLEISIATLTGETPSEAGGQLAYRVTFQDNSVLEWSHLGLEPIKRRCS